MVMIRKVVAILALVGLGGLMLTLDRGAYGVNPRLLVFTRVMLVPLVLTVIGLAMEQIWSRWLALAAAVAVLPWAVVLTFGLPDGVPLMQQTIALVASLLLLGSLPGRAMFERFEGKAKMDWSGPRMMLVRWTIILNIASALGLSLFVVLYRYSIEWHVTIPAVLLLGLVFGVLLLATQKTIGLLLVMVSCVLFVPVGAYFVWKEASHTGEVYPFAASFLPGVIAGWACLFAFGTPLWRAVRAG
jgi:hypothetical protein